MVNRQSKRGNVGGTYFARSIVKFRRNRHTGILNINSPIRRANKHIINPVRNYHRQRGRIGESSVSSDSPILLRSQRRRSDMATIDHSETLNLITERRDRSDSFTPTTYDLHDSYAEETRVDIPCSSSEAFTYPIEPTLPRRFFSTDRYPTDGRVNSYSKLQYLVDVLDILDGTAELETLKNSPFSSLFMLPVRQCALSGKLLHNLLSRQLLAKNSGEIWFTFGGYPLRFSLTEFHKLTGLPCGPYPDSRTIAASHTPIEGCSPYWETLFGTNSDSEVTIEGVVTKLKAEPSMPGWKKLRLVLIVIVEGVLICGTHPVRPSARIVDMVKNLDIFFSYPWGRLSFDYTIRMVKVGTKVRCHSMLIQKLKQKSLVLHGFPIAIQVMLFQSIPLLLRYLPSAEDHVRFCDRQVTVLPGLKTYHTHNILEAENDKKLSVKEIKVSPSEECQQSSDLDGDGDAQVTHMVQLLEGGYMFSKHDWTGGDDSLDKLCLCNRRKDMRCKCWNLFPSNDRGNVGEVKSCPSVATNSAEVAELRAEVARLQKTHASTMHALKVAVDAELHSLSGENDFSKCPTNVAQLPSNCPIPTNDNLMSVVSPHTIGCKPPNRREGAIDNQFDPLPSSGNNIYPAHLRPPPLSVSKEIPGSQMLSEEQSKPDIVFRPCSLSTTAAEFSDGSPKEAPVLLHDNSVLVAASPAPVDNSHPHIHLPFCNGGHTCDDTKVMNVPKRFQLSPPLLMLTSLSLMFLSTVLRSSKINCMHTPNRESLLSYSCVYPFNRIFNFLRLTIFLHRSYDIDGYEVGKHFFTEIFTPHQCLFQTHLDLMIVPFWKTRGSHLAANRIVVIDSLLTQLISAQPCIFSDSFDPSSYVWNPLLVSYLEGSVGDRKQETMWFKDVYTVYTPMNWGAHHWVALVISLETWHINILDPLLKCTSEVEVASYMAPLVKLLPHLIIASVDPKYITLVDEMPFSYSRLEGVPQNTRSGDCGAFVMKFIEMHSHKLSIQDMGNITSEMVDSFRMHYAISVYEEFIGAVGE